MSGIKPWKNEEDGDLAVDEEVETKEPRLYRVFLINDDYTPMDFVVALLQKVFHKPVDEAHRLMLDVHQKGRGLCGVYPYDIARTKVVQAKEMAKACGHPLECIMEA